MLSELRSYRQWVVHRADKIPLNPHNGTKAESDNPATWSDYDTAKNCCDNMPDLGLGFVLTESDPYAVIDLDNAADPKHNFTADKIAEVTASHIRIAEAFDSYSEVSPSGMGLHIWLKGSVPSGKNNRDKCVEVYSSGRYMTVTHNAFSNKPIAPNQDLLMMLWEELGGSVEPISQVESKPQELSDDDVCRMASSGANGNGELFLDLFKNNWQPYFSSQSEADLTFCNIVAFYTDNKEQVGRIYHSSDLFKLSPKKKRKARPDYLYHDKWGIVTKAFDQKPTIMDFSELAKQVAAQIQSQHDKTGQHPNTDVADNRDGNAIVSSSVEELNEEPEPTPVDWMPAPGLMGEIASFIYSNAVNPVREVAIAASIAYLAGIAGRGYNISSTGLNQYVVLLANTSGGKEGAAQGMDKLSHAVREQVPAFERFIGPGNIASPQGLIKQLVETPCILSPIGEFGMWLQKLTGKYARANEVAMRGMLLDLFSKSGAKQNVKGTAYSDRQKNVPDIDSPAFSMFGDSTQQEFYKAIDESNIKEGLISRLTVIECENRRPKYNKNHNKTKPAPELVWRIGAIAKRCLELEMLKTPIDIGETPEATEYHTAYRELCIDRVFDNQDDSAQQIWTRAHLRLLRLAGLVAVGCNPDTPVMTVEHLEWAKAVIEHGCNRIIRQFKLGQVGETNYLLEQRTLINKTVYKFCKTGYSPNWEKAFGVSKTMYDARVITHRYLMALTNKHACFRNDRNPQNAFRSVVQELIDSGVLVKVDMQKVKDSGRAGLAYYVTDLNGLK